MKMLRVSAASLQTRGACARPAAGRPLPPLSYLTVTRDAPAVTRTPPDTQLGTMKLSCCRRVGHSGDPTSGQLSTFKSDGFWGVIAPSRGRGNCTVWGLNRGQTDVAFWVEGPRFSGSPVFELLFSGRDEMTLHLRRPVLSPSSPPFHSALPPLSPSPCPRAPCPPPLLRNLRAALVPHVHSRHWKLLCSRVEEIKPFLRFPLASFWFLIRGL